MTWFPVATEHDLSPRTLFRGQLSDRELVLWRADDGFVNVWENRCLHRGVRLSIGVNEGAELVCRYHGWRYANRSAGCTYIPAHPANSPARTITNMTYPAVERYGLVWTTDDPSEPFVEHPGLRSLPAEETLTLRSLPINVPASVALDQLLGYRFIPTEFIGDKNEPAAQTRSRAERSSNAVTIWVDSGGVQTAAVFFVQPISENRSVIRGVLADMPEDAIVVLRYHAAQLGRFVRSVEADVSAVVDRTAALLEVPVALPVKTLTTGRVAEIEVTVQSKEVIATDIVALEFGATTDQPLPTPTPGAHIDVHLRSGLVRQYSLTNRPGRNSTYQIAVKLAEDSAGGSRFIHESLNVGDLLAVSEPRAGFPLRRNIPHTLFLSGGIGVTPLVTMAAALEASGLDFSFHQFARSDQAVAFRDRLATYGDRYVEHVALSPEETKEQLTKLLSEPSPASQVYCCGPPPMLDAIRDIADFSGWPTHAVHFEYFENATEVDMDSSFTIELARSAQTLEVPSGKTILDVLRAHDVSISSSCESGACGTCQATVLGGEPLHQDVYLNDDERSAGQVMMTCVSRAAGDRLTLDL